MGVAEAFFGVGTMFGPSLGGFLYDAGGFSLPFWVSGVWYSVAFIEIHQRILRNFYENDITKESKSPC